MKISVITTLYNYANYIGDCIESFINQRFNEAEMIIVDDGSTDNPQRVVMPYIMADTHITLISIKNSNYSCAKNVAIRLAQGKYIVPLDADDMLTGDSLRIRYNRILETGADFVHGPCIRYKSGSTLGRDPMWDKWLENPISKWVHAQGVIYKRGIHKEIGLYDPRLWASADREMFNRIFDADYQIETVNQDVALYRIHDKQMSTSDQKKKEKKQLKEYIQNVREKRKAGYYDDLPKLL